MTRVSILFAAVVLAFAVAVPTVLASGGDGTRIALKPAKAFAAAKGSAKFRARGGERELQIEVEHIRRLAGKRVVFYVAAKKLGLGQGQRARRGPPQPEQRAWPVRFERPGRHEGQGAYRSRDADRLRLVLAAFRAGRQVRPAAPVSVSPRGRPLRLDPAELRRALGAERLARAAVVAEEAGFDSGWVTDHLVVPEEHAPIYGEIAEALVSLGFLAGRTERLSLGVSALVVPLRNPLVALKQLTSLDFLSGGRIVTAVAAGWMEGEFGTFKAPFERRGQLLDEWLDLSVEAFAQMPGRIRYEGTLLSVDGWLAPALARPGGPELWVAGTSQATVRRAAKTGVWHPVALPPEELKPLAARFRELRPDGRVVLRVGVYLADEPRSGLDERDRHAIEGPPEWIAERLDEYLGAGSDGFVVNLDHEADGLEERVRRFGEEVVPLARQRP